VQRTVVDIGVRTEGSGLAWGYSKSNPNLRKCTKLLEEENGHG
jgi:hypothetical protein